MEISHTFGLKQKLYTSHTKLSASRFSSLVLKLAISKCLALEQHFQSI